MFQICLCGAQPGYPHNWDCPYPLYAGKTQARVIDWETKRNQIRIEELEPENAENIYINAEEAPNHRISEEKARTLKVEHIGDFWRGRTYPRIRIKGNWVKAAGIEPDTRVTVENPAKGILIIKQIEE